MQCNMNVETVFRVVVTAFDIADKYSEGQASQPLAAGTDEQAHLNSKPLDRSIYH